MVCSRLTLCLRAPGAHLAKQLLRLSDLQTDAWCTHILDTYNTYHLSMISMRCLGYLQYCLYLVNDVRHAKAGFLAAISKSKRRAHIRHSMASQTTATVVTTIMSPHDTQRMMLRKDLKAGSRGCRGHTLRSCAQGATTCVTSAQ